MWARVGTVRMHACVSTEPLPADAPTVILVHGVAVSHRYLMPLAEHLAPLARVYVPDLPGFGLSDKPPLHDLEVPELADWLLAWMDAIGLDRAHMLGNSFGCQVAVDLAMRRPERVRRLVLQGPTMDPHARTAAQQISRWLATALFERKSEAFVLLRDFVDLGPRRLAGMIKIGLEDPIEQKLPRVRVPTLVVRGTRDLIVPQYWAEEAAGLLPNGRLVVIEGAAHTINYSQPAWLRDVIWPFLTSEAGTPRAPGGPGEQRTVDGRTAMTEWMNSTKADGSEPGGMAGADTIEQSAGIGAGRATTAERAVDEAGGNVEPKPSERTSVGPLETSGGVGGGEGSSTDYDEEEMGGPGKSDEA